MDNDLYEELDIWLNEEPPRQEDTVWKSPKLDESQGSFSNQGSFTHGTVHPDPMIEISECAQKSPENSPSILDHQKRKEADEENVPNVLWSSSQTDQMDLSMSRCNNSVMMSYGD